MWTRKKLKTKGLIFFKKYFLTSILVCILLSVVSGVFNYDLNYDYVDEDNGPTYIYSYNPLNSISSTFHISNVRHNKYLKDTTKNNTVTKVIFNSGFPFEISAKMALLLTLIGILGKIFIYNPLYIGGIRYFVNGNRDLDNEQSFSVIFSPFIDGTWASLGIKLLVRDLFIFLWSLLFIIPGIYKSFQYFYVPYVLADDPDLKISDAIDISKEMTTNDKFNIFVLMLSFIGWSLLCILTLGIGYIFLTPYIMATYANLYLTVNENYISNNTVETTV